MILEKVSSVERRPSKLPFRDNHEESKLWQSLQLINELEHLIGQLGFVMQEIHQISRSKTRRGL